MPPKTCPTCKTTLPADAPEGLCPRCLFLQPAEAGEKTAAFGGASPVAPGEKLRYVGDYELGDEIARGGMGVVYRAHQVSLNRPVAVKMILAGSLAGPEAVQRFLAEAEAAASLSHPNIVAIHEVGRHGDQHYFSMDLVEGPDLGRLVATGPLPPARAARYLKTLAEAVQFAHQRGILHRDLKPQNILIDAGDVPKITDFGLAKQMEGGPGLTQSGTVMGSPSYMPREQALARLDQLGPASDVYSLGAVLYELLVGQPPFAGGTPAAVIHKLVNDEPIPPRRLNPEVPKDLETICLKCLEKEPARRYPTARALAEDLGRFLEGQPVLARPAGRVRRLASWAARNPWALCTLASFLLLGAIGLSYGLWEENRYLVWRQSHPGHVRAPGRLAERLKDLGHLGTLVFCTLLFVGVDHTVKSRRQSWGAVFRLRVDHFAPRHPVAAWRIPVYLGLGLAGLAFTLGLAAVSIQAWVWERVVFEWILVGSLFPSCLFSLMLLAHAADEGRAALRDPEGERQTAQQARQRLEGGRIDWGYLGGVALAQLAALAILGLGFRAPALWLALAAYLSGWAFGAGMQLAQVTRRRVWFVLAVICMVPFPASVMPAQAGSGLRILAWMAGCMVGGLMAHRALVPAKPVEPPAARA